MMFLIHAYLQHEPTHQNKMKTIHFLTLPHAGLFRHNSGRQQGWNSIPSTTNLIAGTTFRTLVRMSCQARGPSKSSVAQMVVSRSLKHAFVQEVTGKQTDCHVVHGLHCDGSGGHTGSHLHPMWHNRGIHPCLRSRYRNYTCAPTMWLSSW
jgi:hypothetical protein